MKWEYIVVETGLDGSGLSAHGGQGCELVAVASPGHFVLHDLFKRQHGQLGRHLHGMLISTWHRRTWQ